LIFFAYCFVFKDYSFSKFVNAFYECKHSYLILAVLCIGFWVFFESLFLKIIFKKLDYKISWYQALGYVFTEAYFSLVTPGSSGGQPVQMYEMSRDKIPCRISSIVVFVNTMFYKLSLVIVVLLALIINFKDFLHFSSIFKIMVMIGLIVNLVIITSFVLLIYTKKLIRGITKTITKVLVKLRFIKNIDEFNEKINESIEDYLKTASYIRTHKKLLVETFLIVFFQRLSILLVFYLVTKAFGINSYSLVYAISIQAFLTIAMDSIPIPGGVIVGEGLIMEANEALNIVKFSKDITLIFRGISVYLLVIISFLYYIVFHYKKRRKASLIKE
jgi:hypothetical protein